MDESPVLIAGGGLVGLSAAAFLAQHGVRSVTVERLQASSPLPRAAYFHMRTLEMFRSLGIEDEVRAGSERDFVPDGALIAMDCIAGRKLADIIPSLNEGVADLSPCRRLFLNQPVLEPILRERARQAGATILQGAEIVEVRQDDGGVTVTVRDLQGGDPRELRGSYLIAADGGHSKVRSALGIGMEGRGAFSNSVTIYFTADLGRWLADAPLSIIYVNNPVLHGFFRLNRSAQFGFLAVNTVGDARIDPQAAADAAADLSEARLVELVRAGIGADVPVRIDGHSRWRATAHVAAAMRAGRIFIAGDAAHLMPPNGGFGGNTGIHDVHNLAWKLAQVLRGHAGGELLDSYERERKPVASFTVEQAFARYIARTAPWLEPEPPPEPLADDLDIELGYLYDSPRVHAHPRTTSGVPGARAPHVWLEDAGRRLSTIDLTGRFLLLAGPAGAAWRTAAAQASQAAGIPALDVRCIGSDLVDADGAFLRSFGLEPDGATLVRPDGFAAWRSRSLPRDAAAALGQALRTTLRGRIAGDS